MEKEGTGRSRGLGAPNAESGDGATGLFVKETSGPLGEGQFNSGLSSSGHATETYKAREPSDVPRT